MHILHDLMCIFADGACMQWHACMLCLFVRAFSAERDGTCMRWHAGMIHAAMRSANAVMFVMWSQCNIGIRILYSNCVA